MKRGPSRGFTIVEALASIALISIGIVGSLQAFGALAKADGRAADAEDMQRLAFRKLDEVLAAGGVSTTATSGDFADLGYDRFGWRVRESSTGTGNLQVVTVEVTFLSGLNPRKEAVSGMYCKAKNTGGTK